MTLLSPGGRKALGTVMKSHDGAARGRRARSARRPSGGAGTTRGTRRRRASTRFSTPPITRSTQVRLAPWPRSLSSRAHISGVSVSDTRPEAKIGHHDGDGELAEDAADQAGHEDQRDEHGRQRDRHRENGEADFPGALEEPPPSRARRVPSGARCSRGTRWRRPPGNRWPGSAP